MYLFKISFDLCILVSATIKLDELIENYSIIPISFYSLKQGYKFQCNFNYKSSTLTKKSYILTEEARIVNEYT